MHAGSPTPSYTHHPSLFTSPKTSEAVAEVEGGLGWPRGGECSLSAAGHLHPLPTSKGSVSVSLPAALAGPQEALPSPHGEGTEQGRVY